MNITKKVMLRSKSCIAKMQNSVNYIFVSFSLFHLYAEAVSLIDILKLCCHLRY